jgi:hypothetical protein
MNAISDAISNLEKTSKALEKFANQHENYNSPYSQYLENMSLEMYKHASELKKLNYVYGGY